MRQRISSPLLDECRRTVAPAEGIREFAEGSEEVDDAQSGHGTADVIVRQEIAEGGQRFYEIVAIPER